MKTNKKEVKTVKQVKNMVSKADPKLNKNEGAFAYAVTMLYSVLNSTVSIVKLARATGYSRSFIKRGFDNLRKSGVVRGRTFYCNWGESDIDFWMDVNVALGLLERDYKSND